MGASSSPAAALEHLKHLIQDLIERHGQPSFSHEWPPHALTTISEIPTPEEVLIDMRCFDLELSMGSHALAHL
jgi:hypothetical protein